MPSTELLKPGLLLLFIGFNPSPKSAETGWNYAGPNNRFYRILYESGLTKRQFSPCDSHQLFKEYNYGFTNLVQRPTPKANDVTPAEYRLGTQVLRETFVIYQPKFACFVGKGVFQRFARRQNVTWGFQSKDLDNPLIQLFVGPGTSGLVRMTLEQQVSIYRSLAEAVINSPSDTTNSSPTA